MTLLPPLTTTAPNTDSNLLARAAQSAEPVAAPVPVAATAAAGSTDVVAVVAAAAGAVSARPSSVALSPFSPASCSFSPSCPCCPLWRERSPYRHQIDANQTHTLKPAIIQPGIQSWTNVSESSFIWGKLLIAQSKHSDQRIPLIKR